MLMSCANCKEFIGIRIIKQANLLFIVLFIFRLQIIVNLQFMEMLSRFMLILVKNVQSNTHYPKRSCQNSRFIRGFAKKSNYLFI